MSLYIVHPIQVVDWPRLLDGNGRLRPHVVEDTKTLDDLERVWDSVIVDVTTSWVRSYESHEELAENHRKMPMAKCRRISNIGRWQPVSTIWTPSICARISRSGFPEKQRTHNPFWLTAWDFSAGGTRRFVLPLSQ